jgi:CO/xanthine dehydrogenase Mo-binding subunit
MTNQATTYEYLGKGRKLLEGKEKVTGQVRYAADVSLPNMLYARPVLSPYAHARIVGVDTTAAEQVPGVIVILTAQDLPTRDKIIASRNSAILAKERVLFRGQPVVVVVAETETAAQDAADLVYIDYEPLTPVIDLARAIADDAPAVWPDGLPKDEVDLTEQHAAVDKESKQETEKPNNVHNETHFARGDVQKGFAEADIIIERVYKTPLVHQTYMEPHAVVAEPDLAKGGMTVYTGTQGQFIVRNEVARLLSLPKSRVRVVPMTLGGGFGAKYGIVEPLAASVALKMRQPVKMVLTRSEDFLTTTPSPATIIELKTGAKKDGTITAIQARVLLDNGIFAFALGGIVGILLGGYYKCENVKIDCFEVNTHKPQAGAYRAPGAPSASFALESNVDDMAAALGLDPLEFRLKNVAEDGDLMGNGEPWPSIGVKYCLEKLREHPTWQNRANKAANEGVGIAIGGWPCGVGPAASVCRVDDDGTVRIHVGSVDISGSNSSMVLIAAEILGVSPDEVELIAGDTDSGPIAPPSGGSMVTYSVAGAVANAAQAARKKLLELAANEFEASVEDLEIKNSRVQVKGVPDRSMTIAELAGKAANTSGGPGPIIGEGSAAIAKNAPSFVAHLVKVKVDPETGQVEPIQYVAVQDVGFALNPTMVEGQVHGGAVQGIGWGLHERMVYDESGELLTGSFMDYDIPKAPTVPDIETILVYNPSPLGPFGARGIAEPPITAGPAAIGNAVKDATGVRLSELPLRAETVWQALQENGK